MARDRMPGHHDNIKKVLSTSTEQKPSQAFMRSLTPSQQLKALRKRANMTIEECANILGFASHSGYQAWEDEKRRKDKPIKYEIIIGLMDHFVGKGDPPITTEELVAISSVADSISVPKETAVEEDPERAVGTTTAEERVLTTSRVLPIRYRIEDNKYMRAGDIQPQGRDESHIAVLRKFDPEHQFVVAVSSDRYKDYPEGSELACVDPAALSSLNQRGLNLIVEIPLEDIPSMVELKIARVTASDYPLRCLVLDTGEEIEDPSGILGIVYYALVPQTNIG